MILRFRGADEQLLIKEQSAEGRAARQEMVVGADREICAILNLTAYGSETYSLNLTKAAGIECVEAPVKSYSLYCFDKASSEALYRVYSGEQGFLPEHLNVYRAPLLDFEVREPVARVCAALGYHPRVPAICDRRGAQPLQMQRGIRTYFQPGQAEIPFPEDVYRDPPQYSVEKEDMLDEGVSVLYNTIFEMIKAAPSRTT